MPQNFCHTPYKVLVPYPTVQVFYALQVELSKEKIDTLRKEVEKSNSVFSNKKFLDALYLPSKIIGREEQAKQLIEHIMSLKDGFVVPFISVYGRSGSGKSTVVKFVCESLLDTISYTFVNLRKARTVFGCANCILSELGHDNLKSTEGLNKAIDCLEEKILEILKKENKRFFVLVLDEYDVIFSDSRGRPSDFIYKLLRMEENLREKERWLCIITISNNALSDCDLDDRIKSRMGASFVSFTPYSKSDILGILEDRAEKAFKIKLEKEVLEYCADICSSDHGDARRALDLLRTAGEICNRKTITKSDIDNAQQKLQDDRIGGIISNASYHLRCVAGALCSLSLLSGNPWQATSSIYKKYTETISSDNKPLKYRRVADCLVELENSGLLVSRAYSKGRYGYGKEYKLKLSPEMVGPKVSEKWWKSVISQKQSDDIAMILSSSNRSLFGRSSRRYYNLLKKYRS